METIIYIATHKKAKFPECGIYKPIEVGRSTRDNNVSGVQGDDNGDNISQLNNNFCELTAKYWMWKNINADIVGLVHYRRYFFYEKKGLFCSGESILDLDEITKVVDKNTVILPKKELIRKKKVFIKTVKGNYRKDHYERDWLLVKEIISEIFPEYIESFGVVEKKVYMHHYNMIIAPKGIFNDYCDWLFKILFILKGKIDISDYDLYQRRVFGFISERLLNVFFERNKNINIKEYKVKFLEGVDE